MTPAAPVHGTSSLLCRMQAGIAGAMAPGAAFVDTAGNDCEAVGGRAC
jgi:hypothetical protein